MYRDQPRTVFLKDYRPPEFLVDRVELRFELDPDRTQVEARLHLRRNPAATRGDGTLTLDGEQLELLSVAIDDVALTPAEYEVTPQRLLLRRVPDRFCLVTRVNIHPSRNTALEGLYCSGPMLCTQCEAEGFRRITYFLDRPDIMARFRVTLIADRARFPVLLSNGNPVDARALEDGRHLAVWDDPFPKPCYLFALVAGDLRRVEDRFVTASGREVALHLYVEERHLDQCAHALRSLVKAMRWDEERFGREYDLDVYMIVAVSFFNMGAMENKGLNIFNDRFVLARPETATDGDFQRIESVIAHEYFHNWTGNRITCRDWFQLSLKEGLTVYRDQEFSADQGSRAVKRIDDARLLRAHQFPEDAGPLAHPVRPSSYIEINNFYTATVYEKGAELVRMQAALLGPETFRRAMDRYFERYDGQAVTTEDFVRCMEEASGRDLTQFRRWYTQAGTPELRASGHYDPAARTYTLTLSQRVPPLPGQPAPLPLHIPVAVGLLDRVGRDLPPRLAGETAAAAAATRLLELRETAQTFCFIEIPERPVLSLLRGFSAPVKCIREISGAESATPLADWRFQLAHDSDGFCRWDAAQSLMQDWILARVADPSRPLDESFIDAVRLALRDERADPALRAEVLTLPSESYLGEQLPVIDVDGIHAARGALLNALGRELFEDWWDLYRQLAATDSEALDPDAMGQRALRHLALTYLMHGGATPAEVPDAALALCQAQFARASNMTDTMAALRLLVDRGGAAGEAALASFYSRWSGEALVVDKWFTVQAISSRPETLSRVRALLDHPDFTLGNPNRVRSLLGAFATQNPLRFHAADGSGYVLLSTAILRLDPLNPQVAARLAGALVRWRRFDPVRQAGMRGELERIVAAPELSSDLFEVVSKSL